MFADKVVLVTGGSRGIGASICKMFAKHNARVYINYAASESHAKQLEQEIKSDGGQAECIQADVQQVDQIKTMFKTIEKKEGKLDILVNNAGIVRDALMTAMPNDDWDAVIQTNLSGAFHCSKAAIRLMLREMSGVVINIASVSGIIGTYGQANYVSAKAGLMALTKTMSKELGRFNIRVNSVAPGFIQTEMLDRLDKKRLDDMVENIPLGRIGNVDEVSQVVKFMASDDASYISGQCIVVDGGGV